MTGIAAPGYTGTADCMGRGQVSSLCSAAVLLVIAACASAPAESARREPVIVGPTEPQGSAQPGPARITGLIPAPGCGLLPRPSMRLVRHSYGLEYGKADGRRLLLDLAVPDIPGPHPVVVLFHGGGFRSGHRSSGRHTMEMLALRGYAAASVGYRLMREEGRGRFPAPVSDARCAVRWLRHHAHDLGIDPDRLAAMGFSAGAHLSAMLGTASDVDGLDDQCALTGVSSPRVQAAINLYGPSDFRPGYRVGQAADPVITRFLGVSRESDPVRAALASPAAHVDGRDAPTLLIHGARDHVVDVEQSRHMERTLRAAGVPVVLVELPGSAHGFGLFPPGPFSETATCTTLEFLRRVFGR